jgi:hypothetical protein
MSYYIWLLINGLLLIISTIYIWLIRPHDSTLIVSGQLIAQIAIIFFLVNVNMYFIFLVIKKSKQRKIKVGLSKIARKMMKSHIHLAIFGTSLILIHGCIMLWKLGSVIGFLHLKMITGYIGMILLTLTLFGGYRRHRKASGFRRRFHLVMALIFAVVFIIHLFLPL